MIEVRVFRNKAGAWFYATKDKSPVELEIPLGYLSKLVSPWENLTAVCGRWAIVSTWGLLGCQDLRFSRPTSDNRPGLIAVIGANGLHATSEYGQPLRYKIIRHLRDSSGANFYCIKDWELVFMCCLYAHINDMRLVGIQNLSQDDGMISV